MKNQVVFLGRAADEQFKHWQANNAGSFYLNIKGRKKAMIHLADCWHLGDGEGMNSAANPKICSDNSDELKIWAEDNDYSLEVCSACNK